MSAAYARNVKSRAAEISMAFKQQLFMSLSGMNVLYSDNVNYSASSALMNIVVLNCLYEA